MLSSLYSFLASAMPLIIGPYGLLVFLVLSILAVAFIIVKYAFPAAGKIFTILKDFLDDVIKVQRSLVDEIKDIKTETNRSGTKIDSILESQSAHGQKLELIEREVDEHGRQLDGIKTEVRELQQTIKY